MKEVLASVNMCFFRCIHAHSDSPVNPILANQSCRSDITRMCNEVIISTSLKFAELWSETRNFTSRCPPERLNRRGEFWCSEKKRTTRRRRITKARKQRRCELCCYEKKRTTRRRRVTKARKQSVSPIILFYTKLQLLGIFTAIHQSPHHPP